MKLKVFLKIFLTAIFFASVLTETTSDDQVAASSDIDEETPLDPEGGSADRGSPEISGEDPSENNETVAAESLEAKKNGQAMPKKLGASNNETTVQNATLHKGSSRKIRCKSRIFKPWPVSSDVNENLSLNEKSKEFLKTMEDLVNEVKLVNGSFMTQLLSEKYDANVTNRSTPAECHLVMFYAPWCPFSAVAAPHFNALARLYPDVTLMAVDSSKHQGINTQFGILAIPTVILFHNAKPLSKFNHTEYNITNFVEYMDTFTHFKPAGDIVIMDEDMEGPMPTVATEEPDYFLYIAWLFTIICAIGYFGKSSFCAKIVEAFRNNWREAEIQHEHID